MKEIKNDFIKVGIMFLSIIVVILFIILAVMPHEVDEIITTQYTWIRTDDGWQTTLDDPTDWDVYVKIYDRWNETERVNGSSIAIHLSGGNFINVYHNCTGYEWFDVVNTSGNYSIRYDFIDDYKIQHCYIKNPVGIV